MSWKGWAILAVIVVLVVGHPHQTEHLIHKASNAVSILVSGI